MGNYTAEVQPRDVSRDREPVVQQLELLSNGTDREEQKDGTSALDDRHSASRTGRPARDSTQDRGVPTVTLASRLSERTVLPSSAKSWEPMVIVTGW